MKYISIKSIFALVVFLFLFKIASIITVNVGLDAANSKNIKSATVIKNKEPPLPVANIKNAAIVEKIRQDMEAIKKLQIEIMQNQKKINNIEVDIKPPVDDQPSVM